MLTDKQIVTLSLLNASIDADGFIPSVWVKYPEEAKEAFKELAAIADIFLEATTEIPHNAENDLEPFNFYAKPSDGDS